jgi:hypothetical protein
MSTLARVGGDPWDRSHDRGHRNGNPNPAQIVALIVTCAFFRDFARAIRADFS